MDETDPGLPAPITEAMRATSLKEALSGDEGQMFVEESIEYLIGRIAAMAGDATADLHDLLEAEAQLGIAWTVKEEDLGEPASIALDTFSRGLDRVRTAYPKGDVPVDLTSIALALVQGQVAASRSVAGTGQVDAASGADLDATLEYMERMRAERTDDATTAKLDRALGAIHAARARGADEVSLRLAIEAFTAALSSAAIDDEERLGMMLERAEANIELGGVDRLTAALDDLGHIREHGGPSEVSEFATEATTRAIQALAMEQGRTLAIRVGRNGAAVLARSDASHSGNRRGWWRRRT